MTQTTLQKFKGPTLSSNHRAILGVLQDAANENYQATDYSIRRRLLEKGTWVEDVRRRVNELEAQGLVQSHWLTSPRAKARVITDYGRAEVEKNE